MGSQIQTVAAQAPLAATAGQENARPLDDLRRVAVRYQYDIVSDIGPWQDVSLEYTQRLPFGTVVSGVNGARRYGKSGAQFELQAYPRLTSHSYLFLDAAVSSSRDVFLPLRVVAEPY